MQVLFCVQMLDGCLQLEGSISIRPKTCYTEPKYITVKKGIP